MKFGISTPSNLWRMSIEEKHRTLCDIADHGFDHLFMADHVSLNGTRADHGQTDLTMFLMVDHGKI